MKKYLEMKAKNDTVVNGEEIEFNGKIHIIGAMNEEEIATMKAEGTKLLQTEVTYKGQKTTLAKIKNGKDLFNITEAIELEGNLTGLWFCWRELRMEEKFKKLSPKAQEQIKELFKKE